MTDYEILKSMEGKKVESVVVHDRGDEDSIYAVVFHFDDGSKVEIAPSNYLSGSQELLVYNQKEKIMKKEFKIGDKVIVLTDSKESVYNHGFGKGDIGVITQLDYEDLRVKVEGKYKYEQILHLSELELVNE